MTATKTAPRSKSIERRATAVPWRARAAVYVIFAVSGAAALVYQILWARWLSLLFGSTTPSVAIVLSSFMLGLALGSWYAGRILHRIKNPMTAYAWLELGIGIFAVVFPALTHLVDRLFVALVDVDSPVWLSYAVRAILAFAALGVPTTLMGATLPLLTEFFKGSSTTGGGTWKVGLLYAANTIGAAAGALAASFVLIELVGTRNATLLAAGLNFVVAILAYAIGKRSQSERLSHPQRTRLPLDRLGTMALAVLALGGGVSMASEVLWTRTLETVIGNSSYAFALILVVYLVGLAVGSWLMSLAVTRLAGLPVWLAATQLAIGIWTVAAIALFDRLSDSLTSGQHVALSIILADYMKAATILFPLAVFSGAAFPLATRILDRDEADAQGQRIARAYAWNTIGAMAGAFVAGFVIAPRLDFFESLYCLAAISAFTVIAVALGIMQPLAQKKARVAATAVAGVAVVLAAFSLRSAFSGSEFIERMARQAPSWEVHFHKPGLQGVTTALVSKVNPNESNLLVNGAGMTYKGTVTKMMAHLPMLLHPNPENTLVICFGMGTTYRSAIAHGGDVTVVELVDEVYDAFDVFYEDAERVRNYPRGKMVTNDGRNFLKLSRDRFDVITIDPPPPIDAAGVNHLYSRDFVELARDHLTEGGILAHWIPVPGSIAGVDDWNTFHMLLGTIADVFPHTYVLQSVPYTGMHVLGSMKPLQLSKKALRARLENADVARDLNEWNEVPIDYFGGLQGVDVSQWPAPAAVVTDDRPHLEFYLWRKWRTGTPMAHRVQFLTQ
ncbi:MAG: fused MFS/spermidine synthase [Planctomycetaceae bacterium]